MAIENLKKHLNLALKILCFSFSAYYVAAFFLLAIFFQKRKLKIWKWSDFEGLPWPNVKKKNSKNHHFYIFGIEHVAINLEFLLNIYN